MEPDASRAAGGVDATELIELHLEILVVEWPQGPYFDLLDDRPEVLRGLDPGSCLGSNQAYQDNGARELLRQREAVSDCACEAGNLSIAEWTLVEGWVCRIGG